MIGSEEIDSIKGFDDYENYGTNRTETQNSDEHQKLVCLSCTQFAYL